MTKHKSEDYKLSAVKYFLENKDTQENTCRIFNCSVRSLLRWTKRYEDENEIKRHNREPISYKVKKEHITFFHSIKYKDLASKTKASFCITTNNLSHVLPKSCKAIIVDNVLIATAKITKIFYPDAVSDDFDNSVLDINETSFKDIVKSITIIDIPNQDGSIPKEEFKNKLKDINKKIYLSNSIIESISSISKNKNYKIMIVGSLYLAGEVLNLN